MSPIRTLLAVACMAATFGVAAPASAATQPATPTATPVRQGWHDGPSGPGGGIHRVLGQLNLTTDQKAEIQAIMNQARPQMQAVRESGRANREQLQVTPPTDPGYAALVAFAKTNAAERIQLMSDVWTQVYARLTPDQRARVPDIVAAQRAERGSRRQPPAS
jgi:periplasmic protein CpxP/Spy